MSAASPLPSTFPVPLPMQAGILLGYIDVDATAIVLGTPFPDSLEIETLVINTALFSSLQKIHEGASGQGVKMAFAFTTNRAQEQTFNDLLFKYAALRDSGIPEEAAKKTIYHSTITCLFKHVINKLKLPFHAVANIFDGFGQGVKPESVGSPVGSFFEDVLKPIEADFIAQCEVYYQQLLEFKVTQDLASVVGESEAEFEARILMAIYAYEARRKPAFIEKIQDLHWKSTTDLAIASSMGVRSKVHIFKQVEPFLLTKLAVSRRENPTYLWVDDYHGAIIGTLQEMPLEQKARLLLLHIDHALGHKHSANLLDNLTKQINVRTGKSEARFFTAAWLDALVSQHFPPFSSACCFKFSAVPAAIRATAGISSLSPVSPPPVDTGSLGDFTEDGGIAEVMTPTPSPHRKTGTALDQVTGAGVSASKLAARRGILAPESLTLSGEERVPEDSGTPDTLAPTPATQVETPAAGSGSTLSVARAAPSESGTPAGGAGAFTFVPFHNALQGPGMAARSSHSPPVPAGARSAADVAPHLRGKPSPPASASYGELARSRLAPFSHLGKPAGSPTVATVNPYAAAIAASSTSGPRPKAPSRPPPPPPVSPPPSSTASAVSDYLRAPPSAVLGKPATVTGTAVSANSPEAAAYLAALRRSVPPHLRDTVTPGPGGGRK